MQNPPNPQVFLRQLPLFTQSKILKRNDFLCKSGTMDQHVYVIEEGALIVYIERNDEEQIIRFGYEDNIIVCLDSFFGNKPTEFYMQAIKKTTIKYCHKNDIMAFIKTETSYQDYWNHILSRLIVQQMERETDLLIDSPQERLQRVWKRSPQLFQKIPHKYIANYLRMSPETLSRIKKY